MDMTVSASRISKNFNILMSAFSGKENEIKEIPKQFRPPYKLKFENDTFIYYLTCLVSGGEEDLYFGFCGYVINKEMMPFSEMGYIEFYNIINSEHKEMDDIERNLDGKSLKKYYLDSI